MGRKKAEVGLLRDEGLREEGDSSVDGQGNLVPDFSISDSLLSLDYIHQLFFAMKSQAIRVLILPFTACLLSTI